MIALDSLYPFLRRAYHCVDARVTLCALFCSNFRYGGDNRQVPAGVQPRAQAVNKAFVGERTLILVLQADTRGVII